MQFRARLAGVSGTSPRSPDSPNVISVKIEPEQLPQADWLFSKLGCYLTVEISEAALPPTPLEEAIDAALADDDTGFAMPSNVRRRNGTRSSEQA
jgi:hypothetical protein